METPRILIVDEDQKTRDFLAAFLIYKGYTVEEAKDGSEAMQLVERGNLQMIIADIRMPKSSGLEFVKKAKSLLPEAVIIAFSPFVSNELTAGFLRGGAYFFLEKPFSLDRLEALVKQGLEHQALQARSLKKPLLGNRSRLENIVGESAPMLALFEMVEKVALSDSTILIQGESGTGKELIAHAIHDLSGRRARSFIAVNCAAIPGELLESELFGHIRGSFTGASAHRTGRFELADKGTLFLDEIGDIPHNLQVKLLRVLQSREVEPVGGDRPKKIDVRIIAATNQNLDQMVAGKVFREDLFYRLSVIPLVIPPLRERGSDIPLLLNSFLKKFNEANRRELAGFDDQVVEILTGYPWPGNVRELENLVERLVIITGDGMVRYRDLPEKYRGGRTAPRTLPAALTKSGICLHSAVQEFENGLILQALRRSGGNKKEAALLLNLKRTTLLEKLKRKPWHQETPESAGER